MLRVMQSLPTRTFYLFKSRSRVLIPALVEPEDAPIGVSHPCQLRYGIRERTELALAFTQLFSALSDPLLQFAVELFQLPIFAVQFGENTYLGAQEIGNDRDGNV